MCLFSSLISEKFHKALNDFNIPIYVVFSDDDIIVVVNDHDVYINVSEIAKGLCFVSDRNIIEI